MAPVANVGDTEETLDFKPGLAQTTKAIWDVNQQVENPSVSAVSLSMPLCLSDE